jgi:hypothetical protein
MNDKEQKTVRFIQKTIAELENANKAAEARENVNKTKNSVNNSFVYDTNSKNFVVNHVTQGLIPASQRVNVANVPYDVRGLRKLINSGYFKVPHAPSIDLSNNVIAEVNRRISSASKTPDLNAARVRKIRNVIDAILKEASEEAYGNTKKRILQEFLQAVVLKVNERADVRMISPMVSQHQFDLRPSDPYEHFQIGAKVGDLEMIADVYAHFEQLYGTFDYEVYSNWILTHPSFKIVFDWPEEDTETMVHVLFHTPEYDAIFRNVLKPAFDIVTEENES